MFEGLALANKTYFRAHADLHKSCFVVTNSHSGVDLYSIPNIQLLNSFKHGYMNDHIFKVTLINRTLLDSGGIHLSISDSSKL